MCILCLASHCPQSTAGCMWHTPLVCRSNLRRFQYCSLQGRWQELKRYLKNLLIRHWCSKVCDEHGLIIPIFQLFKSQSIKSTIISNKKALEKSQRKEINLVFKLNLWQSHFSAHTSSCMFFKLMAGTCSPYIQKSPDKVMMHRISPTNKEFLDDLI